MTQEKLRTTKPAAPNGEYTIDLSKWRMKHIKQMHRAAADTDFDAMMALMADVVMAWPHEGNPADVAAYDELTPAQWEETLEQVVEATKELFQTKTG